MSSASPRDRVPPRGQPRSSSRPAAFPRERLTRSCGRWLRDSTATAASFFAGGAGTIYHRVRALPGCDPSKYGPISTTTAVTVIPAKPNVVFTVLPAAVVTGLGDHLEDKT